MTIGHRLTNSNWFATTLHPVTVILMEAFWLFPWFSWAGKWQFFAEQRPPLTLISLILLLSAAYFTTKFFVGRRWPLRRVQFSIIFCGLAAIFIIVRIEYGAGISFFSGQWFGHTARVILDSFSRPHPIVIALVTAPFLWWRGISWGRSSLYFQSIYRSFLVGIVALIVLIIVSGIGKEAGSLESLASSAGLHVAGFFFFGLIALALSHLQTIAARISEREGAMPPVSRRWFIIIVGVVAGITLGGIGIAGLVSAEFVALMTRLLHLVSDTFFQVLEYIFIPIGYLVAGLVYVLQFIVNLFRSGQPQQPFPSGNFSGTEGLPEGTAAAALPAEVILALKWATFAIIAGVITFFLIRAILRYRFSRTGDEIEEIHESLWTWEDFKTDLRLFFGTLWQRFERRPPPVLSGWHPDEDRRGILDIREIYRRLLWEGSTAGIARRRQETADEYASRLGQVVPDGSEQLGELTSLYNSVRYGDRSPGDKELGHANSLWQVIKGLLRRTGGDRQAG